MKILLSVLSTIVLICILNFLSSEVDDYFSALILLRFFVTVVVFLITTGFYKFYESVFKNEE